MQKNSLIGIGKVVGCSEEAMMAGSDIWKEFRVEPLLLHIGRGH